MRALHVVNSLERGGLEVMLARALPHLQTNGVCVDLLSHQPGNPQLEAAIRDQGHLIYTLGKSIFPPVTGNRVLHLLRCGSFDVVHSHLGYVSGGIAHAAAHAGVPLVVSLHSAEPTTAWAWRDVPVVRSLRASWLGWHRRIMDRTAAAFIGQSQTGIRRYCEDWQEHPDRYRWVHNGVTVPEVLMSRETAREQLRLKQDTPVVLHVANFRPIKNYECLFDTIGKVARQLPDVQLLCVGDGDYRPVVESMVRQRGLSDRITFCGYQSDIWRYYAAADVLLSTSWSEGCGNVLLEAQVGRLPVVASDIPAHREAVAPGDHEHLFPLNDSNAAAERVCIVIGNRGSEEAWEYVRDNYSIASMASKWSAIYQDIDAQV